MAGRTVEQGVSLLTAGEIRVAVLPVGPVPRDVLDDYMELINRYHHVSLSATRSFYRETAAAGGSGGAGGKTPFQFMDWSNSTMHLRFLQSEDARRRTRLPDLHPGRQVLAILGVVYCPMCSSVQQAYDEFKKVCRSYPEAFVTRCFVFEPSEDHIRQERDCAQLADLVMFPPGGPTHLEQHLEVWMHDLAAALLTEFEKWMLTASPAVMKLTGYADSAEFTGASAVLDEMSKRLGAAVDGELREKQRWGRLSKMKGDMCLLAGSPGDAAEHYRTGSEIAKACGDWVWYGSALEGRVAARLHEVINGSGAGGGGSADGGGGGGGGGRGKTFSARGRDSGRSGGAGFMTAAKWDLIRRSDTEALARECFGDARAAYKKKGGVAPLQVEQHLKLARLAAGLRGTAARKEVVEAMNVVAELLPSVPSVEDRLVATVECAQVLGLVGCARKRSLLLWHALELARCVGALDKGDLLRIAVRALEPPEEPQVQDPDDLPRTHWSLRRGAAGTGGSGGWEAVHTVALEATLAAAKQAHAPAEAWEAAATLLREHHSVLSPPYQASLLETLAQASAALPSRHRSRPGLGPGPLVQLKRLLPAALPLQPAPLSLTPSGAIAGGGGGRGKGGGYGPFIFNPYAAKRQAKQEAGDAANTPDWACNDEGRVEVYLINPLSVPLKIDQLALHVKYLGTQGSSTGPAGSTGAAAGVAAAAGAVAAAAQAGSGSLARSSGSLLGGGVTPAQASGGAAASAASAAAAAAASSKAFRTPALTLLLAPGGRPHRVVLCGKPQLPGTYSMEGCIVTAWGVTWHAPFAVPLKRMVSGGARAPAPPAAALNLTSAGPASSSTAGSSTSGGAANLNNNGSSSGSNSNNSSNRLPAAASSACPGSASASWGPALPVNVTVLAPLPLVKAIIRASPNGGPLAPSPAAQANSQPGTPAATASHPQLFQPPQPQPQPHQQQQQQQPPKPQHDSSVVVVSPRDDDIHAPPAHSAAFAEDLQRSPPVAVFEGQRLCWSLTLHNVGGLAVTALSAVVTNHKGVPLKPLRGAPLPASFLGVHLEVDDAALQPPTALPSAASSPGAAAGTAGTPSSVSSGGGGRGGGGSALPLRPGCAVTLPLSLAVGQAPRGTFREVSLEVTVSYLSKPTERPADDIAAATASSSPAHAPAPQSLVGRRMTVQLTFEIQPSLCVASTSFLDHYAPLRNGCRLALDRPIDPRVVANAAAAAAAAAAGGGGAGEGDDSDWAVDGPSSRSVSMNFDNIAGGSMARPRFGSLTTASRNTNGGGGGPSAPSVSQLQHLQLPPTLSRGSLGHRGHPVHAASTSTLGLSARLAGLDLSVGASRSGRSGSFVQRSAFALPFSSPGAGAAWLGVDDPVERSGGSGWRRGSGGGPALLGEQLLGEQLDSLTPQGSSCDGTVMDMLLSPCGRQSSRHDRGGPVSLVSATVTPEGPDDALGLVTDSVLCVAVRNTSSYYFRAWLARLDDGAGNLPPMTAAAAAAADCPVEVLQPGDTARLACVLPSAAQTALARMAEEEKAAAAAAASAAARTPRPSDGGSAATAADASGTAAAAAPPPSALQSAAHLRADLSSASSLRRVRLTIQPPGGGTAVAADGGPGDGHDAAGTDSGGGGGGGYGGELAEEADRMAAAEGLAEGWAVVWELVTGLSETAAGRAPPRGMVRLAAVDIARSMSTSAVHALRPSTVHFQFQALPPADPGAGSQPRLKDLTYRLQALGLSPPHVAGSVWGLRAQLGEVLRLDLLLHNRGANAHHFTFSLAAANCATSFQHDPHHLHHHHSQPHQNHSGQQPPNPLQYGAPQHQYGTSAHHPHAMSFQSLVYGNQTVPYGAPGLYTRVPHGTGYPGPNRPAGPHTHDGYYTSGGSLVSATAVAAPQGYGHVGAADMLSMGCSWGDGAAAGPPLPPLEPGIDPGVVLVGSVRHVHMCLGPRSTVRHPLALTFAHPGLYQLYVYDVCVVPEGADAALWEGRSGQTPQPQRVYASVDRLNVLCV